MEKNEILSKLEVLFRDVLDNDDIVLDEDTVADDIDEWDSLSHIMLINTIQKEFSIKFTSREIKELADVGEMVMCIKSKL